MIIINLALYTVISTAAIQGCSTNDITVLTESANCGAPTMGCAQESMQYADGGIGFRGICNDGSIPPDPHLAAGPDHLIAMTNDTITFYEKDGDLIFFDTLKGVSGFWGNVGGTDTVVDPRAIYDGLSQRFFVCAIDPDSSTDDSFVVFAVSDDNNPCGNWHKYRFKVTALPSGFLDMQHIGVDESAVYFGGIPNQFPGDYVISIFDKSSLLAGQFPAVCNALTVSVLDRTAGMVPVSYDSPHALYLISNDDQPGTKNQVRLLAVRNPLTTPTTASFDLAVPSYSNGDPCTPPQKNSNVVIQVGPNTAFLSVAYRNGSLWATHNIVDPNVDSSRYLARWYEINMRGWPTSGQTPTLSQSGNINLGAGVHTYYPAINVDDDDNAAMVYNRSSANEFISIATSARSVVDGPGSMRPSLRRKASRVPYEPAGLFCVRLGDYSAVAVDPVQPNTFWTHHNYAVEIPGETQTEWQTWIASVKVSPFGPLSPDINGDGAVDEGDLNLLLGRWGESGEGDFDGSGVVDRGDLAVLLGEWTHSR